MAGTIRFQIDLVTTGNVLPEVAARLKDLRPAFEEIVRKWADDNKDKFRMSMGAEAGGAEIDPDVFWKGLTPGYIKAKRKAGYPDQIMVATGKLMSAMTSPEGFFHEESTQQAAFGTPKDLDDEVKLGGWNKSRQVVFLSIDDQRMIDKQVSNYLSLGENFKEILFQRGLDASARRKQSAQMDIDLGGTVG